MGSRDARCAVSALPIREFTGPVIGIPVLRLFQEGYTRWVPLGPLVHGMYNGYGGITMDEEEFAFLQPLQAHILKHIDQISYEEHRENPHHLTGIRISEHLTNLHRTPEHPYRIVGDSAFFRMTDHKGDTTYYPLQWAFLRPEVYEFFMSQTTIAYSGVDALHADLTKVHSGPYQDDMKALQDATLPLEVTHLFYDFFTVYGKGSTITPYLTPEVSIEVLRRFLEIRHFLERLMTYSQALTPELQDPSSETSPSISITTHSSHPFVRAPCRRKNDRDI